MKYLLPILLTLTIPEIAYCEIYKWVDKQGDIHFSDRKPGEFKAKEIRLKVNTYTSVTFESSGNTTDENTLSKGSKKVVMYSTSWCGYCKKARAYFKKNNIAYSDYDIEKNPSAKKNISHWAQQVCR